MMAHAIRKVFLVFPPYVIPVTTPKRVQLPLGIAYLGAYLENRGYEVDLCDSLIEGFENSEIVSKDFILYGLSEKDIRRRIEKFRPDAVGISCLFTIQAKAAYRISRIAKELNPETVTVMGGAHPSAMPEEVLDEGTVDFVIPGEGEATFHRLMETISRGEDPARVNGLIFRRCGEITRTPPADFIRDLDDLPFPARHLLPMEKYFEKDKPHGTATRHKRSTPLITSRGCPAQCNFCSVHTIWGRQFRGRSAQNVFKEVEHLVRRYDVREIQVEDDNLTYDRRRAHEILDKIIEADFKLNFTTPNGIAVWALDRPLLEKLKQAGFYRLTLAIESGNEEVLHRIIRKPLRLRKVEEIIAISRDLGFELDTFFVVGFPGETKEQIQQTFDFANRLNVDNAKFFIATPYPGTELLRIASENGYLSSGFDLHNNLSFTKAQISTPDFTADELERMVAGANLKTQLNLFRKNPGTYLRSFFKDYFFKDPSAVFRFLWTSLRKVFE